jgi:hypothetical protein
MDALFSADPVERSLGVPIGGHIEIRRHHEPRADRYVLTGVSFEINGTPITVWARMPWQADPVGIPWVAIAEIRPGDR